MRVWFNQWFSTAYHLIRMMKDGSPGRFSFIGSSRNSDALYKLQCEEWYQEPDIPDGEAYVEFALDFCREHRIDVFFPRRGLTLLSHQREQFREQGTVLAAGEASVMEMLDDKAATYEFFRAREPALVPEYRLARSYEEFRAAYEELRRLCRRVCYKLAEDEGATTFRVIDETLLEPGDIRRKPGMKVTWEMASACLSGYDFQVPMLLMPYLEGQEISVDCLRTKQGDIIIPRFKTDHRYSEIRYDEERIAESRRILDALGLDVPVNIQFRSDGERYYLLEINPRMSGGLQLSCLAAGINVPDIAVSQMIGVEKAWQYADRSKVYRVANLETPQLLACF